MHPVVADRVTEILIGNGNTLCNGKTKSKKTKKQKTKKPKTKKNNKQKNMNSVTLRFCWFHTQNSVSPKISNNLYSEIWFSKNIDWSTDNHNKITVVNGGIFDRICWRNP